MKILLPVFAIALLALPASAQALQCSCSDGSTFTLQPVGEGSYEGSGTLGGETIAALCRLPRDMQASPALSNCSIMVGAEGDEFRVDKYWSQPDPSEEGIRAHLCNNLGETVYGLWTRVRGKSNAPDCS